MRKRAFELGSRAVVYYTVFINLMLVAPAAKHPGRGVESVARI